MVTGLKRISVIGKMSENIRSFITLLFVFKSAFFQNGNMISIRGNTAKKLRLNAETGW